MAAGVEVLRSSDGLSTSTCSESDFLTASQGSTDERFPFCLSEPHIYIRGALYLRGCSFKATAWPNEECINGHLNMLRQLMLGNAVDATGQIEWKAPPQAKPQLHTLFECVRPFEYNQAQTEYSASDFTFGDRRYILGETPTKKTKDAFLEFARDNGSIIICLASRKDEPGREAYSYWDSEGESLLTVGRQTLYKRLIEGVTQFHVDGWRDKNSTVEPKIFIRLFEELTALDHEGPLQVHCIGGIRRSGLFVVLRTLWDLLHSNPSAEINIMQDVFELRNKRTDACAGRVKEIYALAEHIFNHIAGQRLSSDVI